MLFQSYIFSIYFLPSALAVFLLSLFFCRKLSLLVLIIFSLIFYGWWDWKLLPLLMGSICLNWLVGTMLAHSFSWPAVLHLSRLHAKKLLVFVCVAANLLLLGYFKYKNFGLEIVADLSGNNWRAETLIIPLGISFWTFQQIAYVVDVYRNRKNAESFVDYLAFITFFPQLIAGPICYHQEIIPQLQKLSFGPGAVRQIQIGLILFLIGVFKKIVIADYFAAISDPVFSGGGLTDPVSTARGVLSFSLQIYFDFSAYSEMAMGLACMFGLRLPINFYSPYKAVSIVEFWRCWHITLSRFLRDYLYIPLGGNRVGRLREYINILTVMILAGLWHGANWTFVVWGAAHGGLLAITHFARRVVRGKNPGELFEEYGAIPLHTTRIALRFITFFTVTLLWVLFRAESLAEAVQIYGQLTSLRIGEIIRDLKIDDFYTALAVFCVLFLPNVLQLLSAFPVAHTDPPKNLSFNRSRISTSEDIPAISRRQTIRLALLTAICAVSIFAATLEGAGQKEFIYFEF